MECVLRIRRLNKKGEKLSFIIMHGEKKVSRKLKTFICVQLWAEDEEGHLNHRYNPTLDKTLRKVNYDWLIEDTKENREKIIEEIIRRAYD